MLRLMTFSIGDPNGALECRAITTDHYDRINNLIGYRQAGVSRQAPPSRSSRAIDRGGATKRANEKDERQLLSKAASEAERGGREGGREGPRKRMGEFIDVLSPS